MLFNSYQFICLFLPVALLGFFVLAKFRLTSAAMAWLVLASLCFYAYWNVAYLPLLLLSMAANYCFGLILMSCSSNPRASKLALFIAVTANLGALCYYKYAHFFISTSNQLTGSNLTIPEVILPLGISFFTFTQIAYLVDVYRGQVSNYKPLGYALFVTFFPHLIAGPILWHKAVIPQFYRRRTFIFSHKNFALGLFVFVIGLAKKVLIADNLAPWVSPVFDHATQVNFVEAWVGVLSYTFQLFYDFCGYSDMAIGLGLMLNVKLPFNFDVPYQSTSISEFWRRWHMSLSDFLKNYLYIPLGGNRSGKIGRYRNLLATMLLGGLWHGAGWTFVMWGGLHGVYLVINHMWRSLQLPIPRSLAWTATFLSVIVGWTFFRAHSITDGFHLLSAMTGLQGFSIPDNLSIAMVMPFLQHAPAAVRHQSFLVGGKTSLVALLVLFTTIWLIPSTKESMQRFAPSLRYALLTVVLFVASMLSLNKVSEFLYFQF